MRNTGWYIPYWRKPKKKSKNERVSLEEVARSEDQLESVRQRWVERYRRTLRALRLLNLSVGSNRLDVQMRYETLRDAGTLPPRDLEDAYRHLIRVLPAAERRKRRMAPGGETGEAGAATPEANGYVAPTEPAGGDHVLPIVSGETDADFDADEADDEASMELDDEETDEHDHEKGG